MKLTLRAQTRRNDAFGPFFGHLWVWRALGWKSKDPSVSRFKRGRGRARFGIKNKIPQTRVCKRVWGGVGGYYKRKKCPSDSRLERGRGREWWWGEVGAGMKHCWWTGGGGAIGGHHGHGVNHHDHMMIFSQAAA